MIDAVTTEPIAQRVLETEAAIREQRRYLDGLSDPALRASAARTLATLEDVLLIMQRTQRVLSETRSSPPPIVLPPTAENRG